MTATEKIINKDYYRTKNLKVVTYFRWKADMVQDFVNDDVTDKNPKGNKVFGFKDREKAKELAKQFKDDLSFQKFFQAYYDVMDVIHCKGDIQNKSIIGNAEESNNG